jgi:hypothetical protein
VASTTAASNAPRRNNTVKIGFARTKSPTAAGKTTKTVIRSASRNVWRNASGSPCVAKRLRLGKLAVPSDTANTPRGSWNNRSA